jgi:hypothetical protein
MPEWPEQGPFVGRDAVLEQVRQLRGTWDSDTVAPIGDRIDAGDRVVARVRWHGAGRGPDLNMEMSCVYTVRRARIIAFEFFWNHAEALKAVGLKE